MTWNYTEFFSAVIEISIVYKGLDIFLSNGGIEISGFYGIFQIFPEDLPKPSHPSQTNSQTKKIHPVNSSTQAKLEQQV